MTNQAEEMPHLDAFIAPFFFFSSCDDFWLVYVSESIQQVLGYPPSELLGSSYLGLLDETNSLNANISDANSLRFEGDGPTTYLCAMKTRDETTKVLSVQTYRKSNSVGKIFNFSVAQDVTDAYLAEMELKNRFSELEQADCQLTSRERAVLNRITNGMHNKTIASELDISLRTIESTRAQLVKKFNAGSIAEVVAKSTKLDFLNEIMSLIHRAHNLPSL